MRFWKELNRLWSYLMYVAAAFQSAASFHYGVDGDYIRMSVASGFVVAYIIAGTLYAILRELRAQGRILRGEFRED